MKNAIIKNATPMTNSAILEFIHNAGMVEIFRLACNKSTVVLSTEEFATYVDCMQSVTSNEELQQMIDDREMAKYSKLMKDILHAGELEKFKAACNATSIATEPNELKKYQHLLQDINTAGKVNEIMSDKVELSKYSKLMKDIFTIGQ